ncbi:MAG TPA: phosphoribosylanthranilate isomerase [Kiritimatiellia bacterium]|nr:phosphoribosylanthranilate isomerase [Kiritimatiellia bacterium]
MGHFVKICGLANADDVDAVAALRPDAMGFVLWPPSKRAVRVEQLAEWTPRVPTGIRKVGVFVDATPDEVLRAMEQGGLDVAQLHGRERADDFRKFPRPIWRAVSLRGDGGAKAQLAPADLAAIDGWSVDAYLVDTYSPSAPGGTGLVGNWELARAFVERADRPVLLAGGLTAGNVREALAAVKPWGADVSSGVERTPGRKDIEQVREFIKQCRAE